MYDAASVYGATAQAPSLVGPAAPTQRMGTDTIMNGWKGLLHPDNPLFWLGVVLAVTVGAIGVSGSVRLGKAKVAASLDKA